MEHTRYLKEAVDRIEFYLSPENLSEDGELSTQLSQNESGYIPIEEFLQFPDIQGFGVTKEDLMEELSHRETIIISPDGNAIASQVSEETNSDKQKRTIRIEGIPIETSEESLQTAFLSLPEVESVLVKKNLFSHMFSGVINVVLKSVDQVQKFVNDPMEWNGVNTLKKQTLDSYLMGSIEKNKKYEYFPGCLYILKGLPPTTVHELGEYLNEIIPSTANFVYDPDSNFCAIHYTQASDGIACSRIINNTPFHGIKVNIATLQPRSKSHLWNQYIKLLKMSDYIS